MKHNIDHVLDRYWTGDSTLEDEVLLKEYFNNSEIAFEHEPYRELFQFFNEQKKIECNKTVYDHSILLEKYWEGESSESEEEILKAYFRSKEIDDQHLVYSGLFEYFDDQKSITFNPDENKVQEPKLTIRNFNLRRIIYSIAAVSVLVFAAVTVMNDMNQNSVKQQTALIEEIDDPEEALRVTKEALALVSKKFRASQKTVIESMEPLEKAAIFK